MKYDELNEASYHNQFKKAYLVSEMDEEIMRGEDGHHERIPTTGTTIGVFATKPMANKFIKMLQKSLNVDDKSINYIEHELGERVPYFEISEIVTPDSYLQFWAKQTDEWKKDLEDMEDDYEEHEPDYNW